MTLLAVALGASVYGWGVVRLRRCDATWAFRRSAALAGGSLAIVVATVSPLAAHDENFVVHVLQHILLGMVAPLLLVLSAPFTLFLRTAPVGGRRIAARLIRNRRVGWLANPIVGATLSIGAMYGLYLTPAYGLTLSHAAFHDAVHVHFLLAGCLFMWSLVGTDPYPHRWSRGWRTAVLIAVAAAHGILAKLLYALGPSIGGLPASSAPGWKSGAQLMWYGGDVIELLVVFTMCLQWYTATGRELVRGRRRAERADTDRERIRSSSEDLSGASSEA